MSMSTDEERELEEIEVRARELPENIQVYERGPAAFRERMRQAAQRKEQITIRLDADTVSAFKTLAGPDGSYQSLINRALREWLDAKSVHGLVEGAIAEIVARVTREDLPKRHDKVGEDAS